MSNHQRESRCFSSPSRSSRLSPAPVAEMLVYKANIDFETVWRRINKIGEKGRFSHELFDQSTCHSCYEIQFLFIRIASLDRVAGGGVTNLPANYAAVISGHCTLYKSRWLKTKVKYGVNTTPSAEMMWSGLELTRTCEIVIGNAVWHIKLVNRD